MDDGRSKAVTGDPLLYGDPYLESYQSVRVHMNMIMDKVRTEAYREAIEMSRHQIKGKVVMDVGCGTGILSLFAAKAGAKRVIAVECSNIADSARQIMIDNRIDHIVTVVKSKLEDITSLPDGIEKVDVIISEFMGYTLIYESMMDTVIVARDRWLKPGGIIMPDHCSLHIFGIQYPEAKDIKVNWWANYKGSDKLNFPFNLECMVDFVQKTPYRFKVPTKNVATGPVKLMDFDLNTIKVEDLSFQKLRYEMTPNEGKSKMIHGVGTYFDVTFGSCHKPVTFSTSPSSTRTHWYQTVFFFKGDVHVQPNTALYGIFAFRKNARYERDYDFSILSKYNGTNEWFNETNTYRGY